MSDGFLPSFVSFVNTSDFRKRAATISERI